MRSNNIFPVVLCAGVFITALACGSGAWAAVTPEKIEPKEKEAVAPVGGMLEQIPYRELSRPSVWSPGSDYNNQFDPKAVQTKSGRIESIGMFAPSDGAAPGLLLRVRTADDKFLIVQAGPMSYVRRLNIRFNQGKEASVTGSMVETDGRFIVMASNIASDGQTLKLRDEKGQPLWTAEDLRPMIPAPVWSEQGFQPYEQALHPRPPGYRQYAATAREPRGYPAAPGLYGRIPYSAQGTSSGYEPDYGRPRLPLYEYGRSVPNPYRGYGTENPGTYDYREQVYDQYGNPIDYQYRGVLERRLHGIYRGPVYDRYGNRIND